MHTHIVSKLLFFTKAHLPHIHLIKHLTWKIVPSTYRILPEACSVIARVSMPPGYPSHVYYPDHLDSADRASPTDNHLLYQPAQCGHHEGHIDPEHRKQLCEKITIQ